MPVWVLKDRSPITTLLTDRLTTCHGDSFTYKSQRDFKKCYIQSVIKDLNKFQKYNLDCFSMCHDHWNHVQSGRLTKAQKVEEDKILVLHF
jgi:hypothetical protein